MADPTPTYQLHAEHGAYTYATFTSKVVDDYQDVLGAIYIEICHTCSYVVTECLHDLREWRNSKNKPLTETEIRDLNNNDAKLICKLCGIDGT